MLVPLNSCSHLPACLPAVARATVVLQVQSGLGPQAVLGVIPEALTPREISSELIGDTKIVNDMHERKVRPAVRVYQFWPGVRMCVCVSTL
jgi:hypothetical protein